MKYLAVAVTTLLLAALPATPSQAFVLSKPALDYKLHVLECFTLMITDPARRDAECGATLPLPNEVLSANMGSGVNRPRDTRPEHPDMECAPGTEWTYTGETWICDWPSGDPQ